MDLDQQIFILRKLRSAVKQDKEHEVTMTPFIVPNNHTCFPFDWHNNGYFRRRNGDYCKTENPNEADFMLIECSCCHQSFYLMNTGAINWNDLPNKEKSPNKIKR